MTSNLLNNQVTGLLRKAKPKVAPLELPFVMSHDQLPFGGLWLTFKTKFICVSKPANEPRPGALRKHDPSLTNMLFWRGGTYVLEACGWPLKVG